MLYRWIAVAVVFFACSHSAKAQVEFAGWERDEPNKRWVCKYTYLNKDGKQSTQYMVWDPSDPDIKGYYYFSSSDHTKYWGRCENPSHPNYNPKVMQWAIRVDNKWKNLPAGECPAPGDSANKDKDAISKLPPPPK